MSATTNYNSDFYRSISEGSAASAKVVSSLILAELPVKTIVDFGCGTGIWLKELKSAGAKEILGLDGNYVSRDELVISTHEFRPTDLSQSVRLGQKFDLAISLEVAEHVNPSSSDLFVENLTQHADLVLFSAAPPGQGGTDHINERSYQDWRQRFSNNGFEPIDWLRPKILTNAHIQPWYRYNTILYSSSAGMEKLSNSILSFRVPKESKILDLSPWYFKMRKWALSQLPQSTITQLAKTKHRLLSRLRS